MTAARRSRGQPIEPSADVSVRAVGDLVVLEPVRGLRMAVDLPPADLAARRLEVAVVAGQAAGVPPQ